MERIQTHTGFEYEFKAGVLSLKEVEVHFAGFVRSGFVFSGENETAGFVWYVRYAEPFAGNGHCAIQPEDPPETTLLHKNKITTEKTDIFPMTRNDKLLIFVDNAPLAVFLDPVHALVGKRIDVVPLWMIPIYFHKNSFLGNRLEG